MSAFERRYAVAVDVPRTVAFLLVSVVGLAACGSSSEPVSIDRNSVAGVCSDVIVAASMLRLNRDEPANPATINEAASTVLQRSQAATDADLRRAGQQFGQALQNYASAVASGDQAAQRIADGTVRRAAAPLADQCGITLDRLIA